MKKAMSRSSTTLPSRSAAPITPGASPPISTSSRSFDDVDDAVHQQAEGLAIGRDDEDGIVAFADRHIRRGGDDRHQAVLMTHQHHAV